MRDERPPDHAAEAGSTSPGTRAFRLGRLFLWPNSGCNARCRMCDIWQERGGGRLSVEEVDAWADEWRALGLASVILCGESLLHPDIWEIVATIRRRAIEVELLSNGFLVPRHASRIVAECAVLRISLDGPGRVHDETRGIVRAFELLRRAVAAIHALDPGFPVDGRCAVHRGNFRHLRETVQAAREVGFRHISFSGTDVSNEEAFRRLGTIDDAYVSSLAIAGAELAELEAELAAMRRDCAPDFASGFISDTPTDLDRILLAYYRALAGERVFPAVRCDAPWTSAIVEYDGTVRPCFPMPAYGNVRASGALRTTIDAPTAVAFRDALDVATNPVCLRCVCQTEVSPE